MNLFGGVVCIVLAIGFLAIVILYLTKKDEDEDDTYDDDDGAPVTADLV